MKVQSVDSAVWWIGNADEIRSPMATTSFATIIDWVMQEFKFFVRPTQLPGENEGLKFHQGMMRDEDGAEISIREFTLYQNGVNIIVGGPTDSAQKVLEKTLNTFIGRGVRMPERKPIHFFQSEIVADFVKSADHLIANFESVQALIKGCMLFPGEPQSSGLSFSIDPSTLPTEIAAINPTVFRLDRRAGVEYESNRYFSFANSTTKNHVAALEAIERLIS